MFLIYMKKLILLLFLTLSSQNVMATNYCQDANIAACWLFREGSGNTTADSSSNGNTLTFNSATWENNNLPTRSYLTNAANINSSELTAPNSSSLNFGTGNFSIVLWVNQTASSAVYRMVNKWNGSTSVGYLFDINSNNGSATAGYLRLRMDDGTTSSQNSVNAGVGTNTWTHVAVTVQRGSASGITIYVNGSQSGSAGSNTGTTGSITDTSISENIGALINGNILPGYVTEIGLFNRVLSSSEISDIYNNGLKQIPNNSDNISGNSSIGGNSSIN